MRTNYKEKISNGLIVKNYKEMCHLLDEDIMDGNSKKAQIKEWNRYFDYERRGQKFLITNIYDNPIPKEDMRIDNNAVYVKLIEFLLMHELKDKPGNQCRYTKTQLCYLLGLINSNYLRDNRCDIQEEVEGDVGKWNVKNFFERVDRKLSSVIFSALNSMEKRCLISYSEQYTIVKKVYDKKTKSYNMNYRTATPDEVENILKVKSQILKDAGWSKIPFNQVALFYSMVNNELKELYDWDGAYREYLIIYTQEYMDYGIGNVTKEIKQLIGDNKLELNRNFLNFINKQAWTQYIQQEKKNEEIICNSFDTGNLEGWFGYPPDYYEDQAALSDIFIKLN